MPGKQGWDLTDRKICTSVTLLELFPFFGPILDALIQWLKHCAVVEVSHELTSSCHGETS